MKCIKDILTFASIFLVLVFHYNKYELTYIFNATLNVI
jgi:hypothetical protein